MITTTEAVDTLKAAALTLDEATKRERDLITLVQQAQKDREKAELALKAAQEALNQAVVAEGK